MRMSYKKFIDLIDQGPFKFDKAWISTDDQLEALAGAFKKEKPVSYDFAFKGVVLIVEEWLPDNTMVFCKGNEVAAVLDIEKGHYYINPKHRRTL